MEFGKTFLLTLLKDYLSPLGKEVIWVVVDRLNKYAHFVALYHPYSAKIVAQAYMDNIFRLHGLLKSIVSDRDTIFLSTFWQSLFTTLGVDLHLSSTYYPQNKVDNKCLEQYLRCMCLHNPKEWLKWLPLAEYWYNTSFHSASQLTPLEVLYGQTPPHHLPIFQGNQRIWWLIDLCKLERPCLSIFRAIYFKLNTE